MQKFSVKLICKWLACWNLKNKYGEPGGESTGVEGQSFVSEKADFGATHVQSGTDLVGVSSTPDARAMTRCPLAVLKMIKIDRLEYGVQRISYH